jgi:protein-tyrosine phosphatase
MGRIAEEAPDMSAVASTRGGPGEAAGVPTVLVVCTANECRSPSAVALLADTLGATLGNAVRIAGAGTQAAPGRPLCARAERWLGESAQVPAPTGHRSVVLDAAHVRDASLVLGAAREHRSAAVALVPSVQRRAFTLTQAARLAERLSSEGVRAPSGLDPAARLAWWVEELDAWRGDVPRADPDDDDLPDPHDGRVRHEDLLPRLADAVAAVATLLAGEPAPGR